MNNNTGKTVSAAVPVAALLGALLLVNGASFAGDSADGAKIYKSKCVSCHSVDGTGKAKMAKMFKLDVAALSLIDEDTQKQDDAALVKATKDGKGKAMKGFAGKLSDDEIAAVVAHIRVLGAGEGIFKKKCALCHGKDAKGKEKMAKMYKADISDMNLVDDETLAKSDAELITVAADGKGKFMKGFKGKLTDAEIASVICYLRGLAKGAGK